MNDLVISIIRTWVPIGVGYLVVWLAGLGVEIDGELMVTTLVGLFSALYYGVVRFLESKWPNLGWLLGVAKAPAYE